MKQYKQYTLFYYYDDHRRSLFMRSWNIKEFIRTQIYTPISPYTTNMELQTKWNINDKSDHLSVETDESDGLRVNHKCKVIDT